MPAIEPSGDAGRAHQRVVHRRLRQTRGRISVPSRHCSHVGGCLPLLELRHPLKVRTRDFVQLDWKLKLLQFHQTFSQLVDRVIRTRDGAVSTFVMRLELERDIDLLARTHTVVDSFAVLEPPAPTLIERKCGVDEIAMLLQQPRDAVVVAGLFICRERDDDVALRNPTLVLIANQIGDEDRRHRLVIARPAAVIVAVLFRECEWIE